MPFTLNLDAALSIYTNYIHVPVLFCLTSVHLVDYINIRLSYIQLLVLLSKHENAKVHNNAENGSFSHSEEHEENKRKHVQKLLLRYANFYSTFFHVELSENRIANVEAYARTCPLI